MMPPSMRRSDNSIVLTDVNVGELTSAGRWKERCATWTIRYAAEKLAAKYSIGTTVLFDLWTFANPKPNPNELLDADIWAADRLMGANISTQRARLNHLRSSRVRRRVAQRLRAVPARADITSDRWDQAVADLIGQLVTPGIGLATATKLLSIKRPFLIPMMDSVVQHCFGSRDPLVIMAACRNALKDGGNARTLRRLSAALQGRHGFLVSALRILEQLIWFDWNLVRDARTAGLYRVRGFPAWGWRIGETAVHPIRRPG